MLRSWATVEFNPLIARACRQRRPVDKKPWASTLRIRTSATYALSHRSSLINTGTRCVFEKICIVVRGDEGGGGGSRSFASVFSHESAGRSRGWFRKGSVARGSKRRVERRLEPPAPPKPSFYQPPTKPPSVCLSVYVCRSRNMNETECVLAIAKHGLCQRPRSFRDLTPRVLNPRPFYRYAIVEFQNFLNAITMSKKKIAGIIKGRSTNINKAIELTEISSCSPHNILTLTLLFFDQRRSHKTHKSMTRKNSDLWHFP